LGEEACTGRGEGPANPKASELGLYNRREDFLLEKRNAGFEKSFKPKEGGTKKKDPQNWERKYVKGKKVL